MTVDVEVWCNKCDEPMQGDEICLIDRRSGAQSREYTCKTCDAKIQVGLIPVDGKNDPEVQ